MRVLVLESNLMWSARLVQSLRGLGHEPILNADVLSTEADAAIVNLSDARMTESVAALHQRGVRVIAHAGHKEKQLHELGRDAGVDILATNSEITFKLPELLQRAIGVEVK
jgi:glucuronate isomerase